MLAATTSCRSRQHGVQACRLAAGAVALLAMAPSGASAQASKKPWSRPAGTGTLISGRESVSASVGVIGLPYEIGGGDRLDLPTDEAMAISRAVSLCAVRAQPERVKAFLDAATFGDGREAAARKLEPVLRTCLTKERATASAVSMRWGNALTYALNADAYMQTRGVPARTAVAPSTLYDVPAFQRMPASARKTGLCLVHSQPDRAAAVLRATPGSPRETQAFSALVPFIATCTDQGVKATFIRAGLRLELARNYYFVAAADGRAAVTDVN